MRASTVGLAALLAGLGLGANARSMEAEGVAPLDLGTPTEVREAAIQDALHQAGLNVGARISSTRYIAANGRQVESSQLRADNAAGGIRVLKEWTEHGLLHVRVQGEIPGQCGIGGAYRKKVLIHRFDIPGVASVSDMPAIWGGIPLEFAHRLQTSSRLLSEVMTSSAPLMNELDPNRAEQDRLRFMAIATQKNAQILVSGRVLDTSVAPAQYFWEDDVRHFEVEIRLIDGLTGTEIAVHKAHREASGRIDMLAFPFGSEGFFKTDYGRAVDETLSVLVNEILNDLNCLPFSTRIQRVDGHRLYLNAGTTSGVAPGDTLAIYTHDRQFPRHSVAGHHAGGIPEIPSGTARIISVQPQLAIAEVIEDETPVDVREGDIVRLQAGL